MDERIILTCIAALRKRKCRPDQQRIVQLASRKHGLGEPQAKQALKALVNSGRVTLVEFKGGLSYRDVKASGSSHRGTLLNSWSIAESLQSAVRAVGGEATEQEVSQYLQASSQSALLKDTSLLVALGREVHAGRLALLPSGKYVISNPKAHQVGGDEAVDLSRKEEQEVTTPTEDSTASEDSALSPKVEEYGPAGSGARDQARRAAGDRTVCRLCLQVALPASTFPSLVCTECRGPSHGACLGYSEDLVRRATEAGWQCNDCKVCVACQAAGDAAELLLCDACDRGFHMSCLSPPLAAKPEGDWLCPDCVAPNTPELLLTLPGVAHGKKRGPKRTISREKGDPIGAELSTWSCKDVYDYLKSEGLQLAAETLRRKHADGRYLAGLSRGAVLTALNLPLGPALKLYRRLYLLQSRTRFYPHPLLL